MKTGILGWGLESAISWSWVSLRVTVAPASCRSPSALIRLHRVIYSGTVIDHGFQTGHVVLIVRTARSATGGSVAAASWSSKFASGTTCGSIRGCLSPSCQDRGERDSARGGDRRRSAHWCCERGGARCAGVQSRVWVAGAHRRRCSRVQVPRHRRTRLQRIVVTFLP